MIRSPMMNIEDNRYVPEIHINTNGLVKKKLSFFVIPSSFPTFLL